jgi:hypothetical protein
LTTVQLESFSIADRFQQTILKLNNTILLFQIRREPAAWDSYLRESEALDRWIDEQVDKLKTDKERDILQMLNTAYDDYRTAAREIGEHVRSVSEHDSSLVEFARFQKESDRLLSLGYRLAAAHRDSLNQFLTDSKRSVILWPRCNHCSLHSCRNNKSGWSWTSPCLRAFASINNRSNRS